MADEINLLAGQLPEKFEPADVRADDDSDAQTADFENGAIEVPAPAVPGIVPAGFVLVTDASVRDAVKTSMLDIAEALTVEAGYAAGFKDKVYGALVQHVRKRFLKGNSLGLADRADVEFAWKMLPQVMTKVGAVPGLVAGIIEYGD